MVIFNTVDTIHTIIFLKYLISSLPLEVLSYNSITSTPNFALLSCAYPPQKASVYSVACCLECLFAVPCSRISSDGALRSQGAGVRPLCSLAVRPGQSHRLQKWKRAVPHQSGEAQRYALRPRPGVTIRNALDRAQFAVSPRS